MKYEFHYVQSQLIFSLNNVERIRMLSASVAPVWYKWNRCD